MREQWKHFRLAILLLVGGILVMTWAGDAANNWVIRDAQQTIYGDLDVVGELDVTGGIHTTAPLVINGAATVAIDVDTSLTGVASVGIDLSGMTFDSDDKQIVFKGINAYVNNAGYPFSQQMYVGQYLWASQINTRNSGNNMLFDIQSASAHFGFRDKNDNELFTVGAGGHGNFTSGGLTVAHVLNIPYGTTPPSDSYVGTGTLFYDTDLGASGTLLLRTESPAGWLTFDPDSFIYDP